MPHQTLRRLPKLCVSAPHGGLGHRQYDTRHAVVDATCPTSVNVVVLRGDLSNLHKLRAWPYIASAQGPPGDAIPTRGPKHYTQFSASSPAIPD